MLSNPTSLYLDELLNEMSQLSESSMDFKNTRILLSREISRVFEEMTRNDTGSKQKRYGSEDRRTEFFSPQIVHPSPSVQSPYTPYSSFQSLYTPSVLKSSNPFVTPMKHGRINSPEQFLGDWTRGNASLNGSESPYVLQTKIYIPEAPARENAQKPRYNYVGRILGPSGSSARQIESQYDVTLLIRGAGSMKDARTEAELKGRKKYEHLNERLHVLLIARNNDKQKCEQILDKAAEKIESLLVPVHDDYKKDQLVRYAIMNGTYEMRSDKKMESAGRGRRSVQYNQTHN
ncbi:Protein CBG06045 [Caenorhabditis briggsae]|uniref:K Homology domain-containing protein n=2 Tax=Caenorhabditis briggsae TaxID=6238 RepID=A0AAE9AH96_CAEBR|nr:Protein CBG06045 [Caenorhabditis briggsae]ULT95365.1 hypothetical protein L3Y34_004234 [Caenorhabditis briggsae]CAP26323.1 Protein CBG06045 [Caenorhabditis briggsae]